MGLDRFSNGRILTGGVSNIFGFSIFLYACKKYVCMVFLKFYATTVNISMGIYTIDLFTWGLGFMMQ